MTAAFLAIVIFVSWSVVGFATLGALRVETNSLRLVLTAPVLGTAVTGLPLFVLSRAGVGMSQGGPAVVVVLLLGSIVFLAVRRPSVPRAVAPVIAVCLAGLPLAAWPMWRYGFHWLAFANDDMANYVLSATYLLHHGVLAKIDVAGISHYRDYASVSATLHRMGSRPGADITLSALSGVTGRPPYEVFMPLMFALEACTVCAAGALAMQATRRWWAAAFAAGLVAVSPQATYGVLLQLVPQVWGLGLAAALCAVLMRRELYRPPPRVAEILLISLLAVTLVLVYVELASTVVLAYLIFLGVLALRRDLDLRAALCVWIPPLVLAAFVLNTYGWLELTYVKSQATAGVHGIFQGPPNWGYTLLPSALPGILGVQALPALSRLPSLQWLIAGSALVLAVVLIAAVRTALLGVAAAVTLVSYAILGAYLAYESSDFGLFKLFMYVQPFLAAAVAVWLTMIRRRPLAVAAAALVVGVVALQLSTQQVYVREALNPLALHDASADSLLPTFATSVAASTKPVITVTENPVLGKLESAMMGQRPLYLMSQSLFANVFDAHGFGGSLARQSGWKARSFALHAADGPLADPFWENVGSSNLLSHGNCMIVLPKGDQIALNRRLFPERSGDLAAKPCGSVRNVLVFTASKLGWGFSGFNRRDEVAMYPPAADYAFPGHSLSGIGRYILLRVIGPSKRFRIEAALALSDPLSPFPDAAIVGTKRVRLPFVGGGSARVVTAPLAPQVIDGQSYVLLDMGRPGALPTYRRSGLAGLYSRSVPVDPRYLTAFLRDISVVTDAQYRRMRRPLELAQFPSALANPNLEYSGIYDDGWAGRRSFVVLGGGPAGSLRIDAEVPPVKGGQGLRVLLNGKQLVDRAVEPGTVSVVVRVPRSKAPRRVTLLWRASPRLSAADRRHAAAYLRFLGIGHS
jgi:hypothetical protein